MYALIQFPFLKQNLDFWTKWHNSISTPVWEQVCLPEFSDHVSAGVLCWTGGYGSLRSQSQSELRTFSNVREVEVKIMADKYCRRSALSSSGFIWNEHFCADFLRKDPAKACSGDLGGALICVEDNRPIIFGVTSLADKCGLEDHPAVYAKLSQYTRWIEQIIYSWPPEMRFPSPAFFHDYLRSRILPPLSLLL